MIIVVWVVDAILTSNGRCINTGRHVLGIEHNSCIIFSRLILFDSFVDDDIDGDGKDEGDEDDEDDEGDEDDEDEDNNKDKDGSQVEEWGETVSKKRDWDKFETERGHWEMKEMCTI